MMGPSMCKMCFLPALHAANSALDGENRRCRHEQAELWRQGVPRAYRPSS